MNPNNVKTTIFLVIICFISVAQSTDESASQYRNIQQTGRYEYHISKTDFDFTIIPADDYGLAVVTERKSFENNKLWSTTYLDTALQQVWKMNVSIPWSLELMGYEHYKSKFYLLGIKHAYSLDYSVLEIDKDTKDTVWFNMRSLFPIELTEFEVVGRSLIFGGYTEGNAVVLLYDLEKRKFKVLPNFFREKRELIKVLPNDHNGTFAVLHADDLPSRQKSIEYRIYDQYGKEQLRKEMIPPEGITYRSCLMTFDSTNILYLGGTYALRNQKNIAGYMFTNKYGEMKHVPQNNLPNVFQYLGEKREGKAVEKATKLSRKGKVLHRGYRVSLSELIFTNGHLVLHSEAYYPKYSNYTAFSPVMPGTINYGLGDFGSRLTSYDYSHSCVIGVSDEGVLKWSNTFEYQDLVTFSLSNQSTVSYVSDTLTWLYANQDLISSRVLSAGNRLWIAQQDSIKLGTDELKAVNFSRYASKISRWYDDNFYISGKQSITKKDRKGMNGSKQFFYVNKISLNRN